jgi:tryptophan-rich sensory protein
MMKLNWLIFAASLIIAYSFAFIGSIFTPESANSAWYESVKPEITPPNWAFPVVWNILFFMIAMSIHFFWISKAGIETKRSISLLFGINLALNALWSYSFFGMRNPEMAFYVLVLLQASTLSISHSSWRYSRAASLLLMPYFLWVCFAGILNWMIAF